MSATSLAHITVVMPALNEQEGIQAVLHDLNKLGVGQVIVVNDASGDQTGSVAEALGATVLNLPVRLGAWGATQAGIRYALRQGADVVVSMDADGQHLAESIPALIQPLKLGKANVVIGCNPERASTIRRFAWRWIKATSGLSLEDITSGFRAYDHHAIRKLAGWNASLVDYQDVGVLLLLQRHKLSVIDVPVPMQKRCHGKSRIFHNWGIVAYYMAHTLLLGFCKRNGWRSNAALHMPRQP